MWAVDAVVVCKALHTPKALHANVDVSRMPARE